MMKKNIYKKSFDKKVLIALLMNSILIITTILITRIITLISQPQVKKIDAVDLSSIVSQTEAQLQATAATLKNFALFAISVAVIFILLLIINWSITQGMTYSHLLKKKITLRYLNRFLLLNIIWIIPWTILLVILLIGGKEHSYLPILILFFLFIHFTLILNVLFTKKNSLSQIKQALKLGTLKFHRYLVPYLIITVTFIIISQLNLLSINYILLTLIYLLFFSWTQNYLKDITINL